MDRRIEQPRTTSTTTTTTTTTTAGLNLYYCNATSRCTATFVALATTNFTTSATTSTATNHYITASRVLPIDQN